jgi:hypothetical protein
MCKECQMGCRGLQGTVMLCPYECVIRSKIDDGNLMCGTAWDPELPILGLVHSTGIYALPLCLDGVSMMKRGTRIVYETEPATISCAVTL